jgi:hypothetical protein
LPNGRAERLVTVGPSGRRELTMNQARINLVAVVALAACGLSCGGDDSAAALDAAYGLGERSSRLELEAAESGRRILDEIELEPFTYRRAEEVGSAPTLATVCGVRYRISKSDWGLVPDLTYPCDDEAAAQQALGDAREQLESHLSLASSDYALRLTSLVTPGTALTDVGPELVFARGLGVDFDLDACFDAVGKRLAEATAAMAALQCETFLAPGSLLEDFREGLSDNAESARDLTAVRLARPASVVSPDVARLCQAQPGPAGPPVPGTVAGTLSGGGAAHAIRLAAGESVVIDLRSDAFDSVLTLYDDSCSTQLGRNDDGAGGSDSRLEWSSFSGGDYVLVVGSYGSSGATGPYRLSVAVDAAEPPLDEAQREAVAAFVRWAGDAPAEELLDAWRGSSAADLQLGCLRRERFRSSAGARAAVAGEARSVCLAALAQATEARKTVLAAED